MTVLAAAVAAALLGASPPPQLQTPVRDVESTPLVRLTYRELAAVSPGSAPSAYPAAPTGRDLRLPGDFGALQAGVRTIAVSAGSGSVAQAITNVSVGLTLQGGFR